MVVRAERVSQTEVLAFCYADITTAQSLEAYNPLAGRIFHLTSQDSLSKRVMEKYATVCAKFQATQPEGKATPLFGENGDLRAQALAFTLTELRSSLYRETPTRHVQARIDATGCYFQVVTEGTDGLSELFARATT